MVAGGNRASFSNTQISSSISLYFDSPLKSLIIANDGTHDVVCWVLGDNNCTSIVDNVNGMPGGILTSLVRPMGVAL